MAEEYNFQAELEASVNNAETDRDELVTMIFKSYVAKCLEITLHHSPTGDRLPADAVAQVMRNLVTEFRKANLGPNQKSEDQYATIFDKTVEEILNDAALAHNGSDLWTMGQQQLEVNGRAYRNEGGLYLPG